MALGIIALLFLHKFENKIFPTERFKLLEISYKDNTANTQEAQEIIKKSGILVQTTDVNQGSSSKGTKLRLLVRIPNTVDIASIARSIKALDRVGKVEIKEKY